MALFTRRPRDAAATYTRKTGAAREQNEMNTSLKVSKPNIFHDEDRYFYISLHIIMFQTCLYLSIRSAWL